MRQSFRNDLGSLNNRIIVIITIVSVFIMLILMVLDHSQ